MRLNIVCPWFDAACMELVEVDSIVVAHPGRLFGTQVQPGDRIVADNPRYRNARIHAVTRYGVGVTAFILVDTEKKRTQWALPSAISYFELKQAVKEAATPPPPPSSAPPPMPKRRAPVKKKAKK